MTDPKDVEPFITDECDAHIEAAVKQVVESKWTFEEMMDEFHGALCAALHRLGRSDIAGEDDED